MSVRGGPVIVVGAGLAGLRCAQVLTENGLEVVVIERESQVGGRLRSFRVDGFVLDQGFQLVNPAYPELIASNVLTDLDLRPFDSAVEYHHDHQRHVLADPRRQPRLALASLRLAPPGQLLRLATLLARAAWVPAQKLSARPDATTRDGLRRAGLSDKTIDDVVRPFLRGTLLDDELTSSWIFTQLLLKSFAKGRPSTHPDGIAALAHSLSRHSGAEIRLNTAVTGVSSRGVEIGNTALEACAVVVATDGTDATNLVAAPATAWQRQVCWWWSTPKLTNSARLRIDLDDTLTTSALDLAAVAPERAPDGRSLIATPSLFATASDVERARTTVARLYDLATSDVELIAFTEVVRALPHVAPPFDATRTNRLDGVVLAGDYLTSSSIQGALVSGRRAASTVLRELKSA